MDRAVSSRRKFSLQALFLNKRCDQFLERTTAFYLKIIGRPELAPPLIAAIRELVQNAYKANLKRIVFKDLQIDPTDAVAYDKGIKIFRSQLILKKIKPGYLRKMRTNNMHFAISFQHIDRALRIFVRNPDCLYGVEDRRVREKFYQARNIDNLYDFYAHFPDETEGAGMGIAMVKILLQQAGCDYRSFCIYSDEKRQETVAQITLPSHPDYNDPRQEFVRLQGEWNFTPDELRRQIQIGSIRLPSN